MSITKRIFFGAGAAWLSRGLQILVGLILLPVLFRNLSKEELGVWILLGQSWAAMGIFDLGFSVTLTRRIALAKGKSGTGFEACKPEAMREIADLVAAGRRIYRSMAGGVFLVSWALGFFYLRYLDLQGLSHATVWVAWTILCVCQALTVWAAVWTSLLQGVGYVGWDVIIASFVSIAMLLGQIIAVLCGGGLVALAAIAAMAAVFQQAMTRWFVHRRRPELFSLQGRWNPAVLQGMPGLALRTWLTTVGTILIFNTDQFFIAALQGAEGIPAYRAAYLVVLNINILAITFASSSAVFISHLWQARESAELRRIVQRNVRLGLLIMLCGSAWVLSLGSSLFDAWIGPGKFIGYPTLIVFCALLAVETHSFIIVAGSRATEDEAFAFSTLAGGVLKLSLSWVLMQSYGLLGIAAGTLIAQLLTNGWFMSYRGLRRLGMSLREHVRDVVIPVVAAFILALSCNLAVLNFFCFAAPLTQVIAAGATTLILVLASCWILVLDGSERTRIRLLLKLLYAPANL